jgi:putative nucleotidyltransferase with HDIG domain
MKKNHEALNGGGLGIHLDFLKSLKLPRFRLGPALATGLAFVISTAVILGMNGNSSRAASLGEIEAGKVAERDVVAEQAVSYIDEGATQLRIEAQERLVPAVFSFSPQAREGSLSTYDRFTALAYTLFANGASADAFKLAVQAGFPGAFPAETMDTLFRDPNREQLLEYGKGVLEALLERGIFALPHTGLELYNPDLAELVRGGERERLPYDELLTIEEVPGAIDRSIAAGSFPASFAVIAVALLRPFIAENVFFSPEDTRQRLVETRAGAEPVVRIIEQGKPVIRKGFIVTDENMVQLRALTTSAQGNDPRVITGQVIILFLLCALIVFLSGARIIGRGMSPAEIYLISTETVIYITAAVLLKAFASSRGFPVALFLPTALVVMLPSILINSRMAVIMALVLPLAAFLSGSFDAASYIFALTSGAVAAYTLQGVERRMDLLQDGCIIAAANGLAAAAILLVQTSPLVNYPGILFWAAFNGLVSGVLVLGFLPMLEHALNAVTPFRLSELSDLNAPLLKRLFTAAPGTYSHSVMVANLAEAACQEIGANALLARVGAYYHDIGKMEQPDYFVENQAAYNKHDDIAPRLSATILRSHVKFGVEKARSLGLPREVVDIISEHHGNSVISWFYNEALKRETADSHGKSVVNMEDFTYPGKPPHSRESAVVMLADVTEAATRTLKKPNTARLEKFIQELIMSKFQQGQLSESELTFRDLETIKKTFVRVLAGHYHSRIEYPKTLKEAVQEGASFTQGVPDTQRVSGAQGAPS